MELTTAQYIAEKQRVLSILQRLEEQVSCKELCDILNNLETVAEEQAAVQDRETKQVELQLKEVYNQLDGNYQEVKQAENERGTLEIARAKLLEQLKQNEIVLERYENTCATLRIQLQYAYEQERTIQKQFWISFVTVPQSAYQKKIEDLDDEMHRQKREIDALREQTKQLQAKKQNLDAACWENRQKVNVVAEKIAACREEHERLLNHQKERREAWLQWQTQKQYFRFLQEKLSGCKTIEDMTEESKAEMRQLVSQAPEIWEGLSEII